jgi:hypothetical protein
LTVLHFLISFRFLFFAESAPQDWLTLDSERVKIYYTAANRSLAAALPAMFENEYADLSAKLGLQLDIPVQVLLAPTPEKFNELTGHLIPDWGEGVADAARGLIILKTLSPSSRDRLRKLVRHELTHILIGRGVAQPETLPRWFHEGLAIYFSYDEEFAGGAAISKALISNSVVPLNEIEDVLKFQTEKARLAYEESFSAVLYLEEEFGFAGIAAILAELKAGKAFDDAFEEYTGLSAAEFELNWLRFVEQKYRWRFLLDFETYLWILILLLFVLVFFGIKWRNRRTLKRWEDEEKILGR